MDIRMTAGMKEVAERMAKEGRTEFKIIRRPRWKECTLIKFDGKKEISREKIWVNESEIFPSDEDFFWEPKDRNINNTAV